VTDDGDRFHVEGVHHSTNGLDVLIDRHRRGVVESARSRRWEVDDVTRDLVDKMRQKEPEGGAADGPAVNEQHLRAGPHRAEGGFTGPDVDHSVG
jgi:hypothetical protein